MEYVFDDRPVGFTARVLNLVNGTKKNGSTILDHRRSGRSVSSVRRQSPFTAGQLLMEESPVPGRAKIESSSDADINDHPRRDGAFGCADSAVWHFSGDNCWKPGNFGEGDLRRLLTGSLVMVWMNCQMDQ
jgi:hypothetical protein